MDVLNIKSLIERGDSVILGGDAGSLSEVGELGDEWGFTLYDANGEELVAFIFHDEKTARTAHKMLSHVAIEATAIGPGQGMSRSGHSAILAPCGSRPNWSSFESRRRRSDRRPSSSRPDFTRASIHGRRDGCKIARNVDPTAGVSHCIDFVAKDFSYVATFRVKRRPHHGNGFTRSINKIIQARRGS